MSFAQLGWIWFMVGWLVFMWLADKREREDFNENMLAIFFWPVALFNNKVRAPLRRRRERSKK